MNWYEFVFSGKLAHRIMRHTAFWLLWWVYFAATYYYYLQVGLQQITFGNLSSILLIKTFLLIIIHFVACYCFIYIFLPRYLLTRKHFMLITGIVFLIAFLMIAGYGMHLAVFPLIDLAYHRNFLGGNSIWWTNINSVLLNAPKVIAAATAIKLVKYWYLKQKEKELLEKEKLITDLQLMKAPRNPKYEVTLKTITSLL